MRNPFTLASCLLTLLSVSFVMPVRASTVTITGAISQSTEDGTGPALNNPGLNDILDNELFNVSLTFNESITSPGTFDLTGLSLLFSVAETGVVEDGFNFASLTVAPLGSFDQVGIFACLTTGSGCNQGNELDLNFLIPSASLNSQVVSVSQIPGLLPLDLLEDDGVTDIHGLIANYSYTSAPEPAAAVLIGGGLLAVSLMRSKERPGNQVH